MARVVVIGFGGRRAELAAATLDRLRHGCVGAELPIAGLRTPDGSLRLTSEVEAQLGDWQPLAAVFGLIVLGSVACALQTMVLGAELGSAWLGLNAGGTPPSSNPQSYQA